MAKRIGKRARAYFERHRSGSHIVFDTRGSTKGYMARYRACQALIDAGIIEGTPERDSGFARFHRILIDLEAEDAKLAEAQERWDRNQRTGGALGITGPRPGRKTR